MSGVIEAQWRLSLDSGLLDSLLPRDNYRLELCEDSPKFGASSALTSLINSSGSTSNSGVAVGCFGSTILGLSFSVNTQ